MDTKIKKKYAVCIFGQLRAVDTVIENFNNFLIKPLDADLYVFAQNTGTDIDKNIDLFETSNKIIYNPPNNDEIYTNLDKLTKSYEPHRNYIINSHLNIYLNFLKIAKTYGDIFQTNYEYIIVTRSDYFHLFDFPDILKLTDNTDLFWCYDGHEYGGINNTLICVPSKYIIKYLSCAFNFLQNPKNIIKLNSLILNIEEYYKLLFDNKGWKIGKIQNNAFLTASKINDITTSCKPILYSEKHNVFYKYIEQLTNSFESLNNYNKNNKWIIINNNKIVIEHSNKYSFGQLNYRI
jgi:hypothetical protein